jgi:glycosyltransferase involved in cell wall biosynthesis
VRADRGLLPHLVGGSTPGLTGAKPLTIAHVQTRMNRTGGCEENTWASCVHQSESGHDVHLVCGRSSDVEAYRDRHPRIAVHQVNEMVWNISPADDWAACQALKRLFEDIGADIIHTHSSKAGILGRVGGRMAGVPALIHGVHILPFSNVSVREKLTYVTVEHVAALMTDHFIHVSEGTRTAYRKALVGTSKPHKVVRSGMKIDQFKGASWPADWQQILGTGDAQRKPVTILMMAVLETRKRHAQFLEEFARITEPGENIRVLFAGDGPEQNNLEEMIAALGLGDRVTLLGYRRDPENLVALSDLSVLCSLREGLPRVIVQSLAGGKPAVVSPFPGIEEIVKHGTNGIVATTREAEDVAREAVSLARDRQRLAAYTAGAMESPVSEWSFNSMFEQLDAAYAACLAQPAVAERLRKKYSPVSVNGTAQRSSASRIS